MNIYDDFIPEYLYKQVKEKVTHPKFRWMLSPTAYMHDPYLSFANINENDEVTNECHLLLKFLQSHEILNDYDIIRIRWGLIHRDEKQVKHLPHVDYQSNHKVGLWYFDNTDGYTTIFNENYDLRFNEKDNGKGKSSTYLTDILDNKLTIKKEIKPKENRFVLFDGMSYHCSQTPTETQTRTALNIIFMKKDEIELAKSKLTER